MKRNEKYPDTNTFRFYNANPKGRITGDCVFRAIATASAIPYNDVVMDLAKIQCETGYDPCEPRTFGKYLESKGFTKHSQLRKYDGTKYTGREFCELLQRTHNKQKIVANVGGGHTVAIIDNKIVDTWNSTEGCVGNYWTK